MSLLDGFAQQTLYIRKGRDHNGLAALRQVFQDNLQCVTNIPMINSSLAGIVSCFLRIE